MLGSPLETVLSQFHSQPILTVYLIQIQCNVVLSVFQVNVLQVFTKNSVAFVSPLQATYPACHNVLDFTTNKL
jgi:hypothetical protein